MVRVAHSLGEATRTQCKSHLSEMLAQTAHVRHHTAPILFTTLRLTACMVLIVPVGASHASGMMPLSIQSTS